MIWLRQISSRRVAGPRRGPSLSFVSDGRRMESLSEFLSFHRWLLGEEEEGRGHDGVAVMVLRDVGARRKGDVDVRDATGDNDGEV